MTATPNQAPERTAPGVTAHAPVTLAPAAFRYGPRRPPAVAEPGVVKRLATSHPYYNQMKTIAILLGLFYLPSAFSQDAAGSKPESDALAQAIVSSNWSWEQVAGGPKAYEEVQFYQGGLAENSKFWTGRWEVAGPRMLVVENTKRGARHFGHKAYLVFDTTFTHFVGFDFNGKTTVEGFRREAVDSKRQPPEAKRE
jgi:hypothetical protein